MNTLFEVQLDLGESIIGFENLRYFQLETIDPVSPFYMLQSSEEQEVGFVVVSPFDIYPDYEFRLSDEIIERLKIEKPEEVAVYSIVTVKKVFGDSTINLVAPIVINVSTGKGLQFILNNVTYAVNAPINPIGGRE